MALSFDRLDFRDLYDKFEEMESKMAKQISQEIVKEGAEKLKEELIVTAPEDTGKLKSSLEVYQVSGSGAKATAKVGINPAKRDELRYGFYQEYGTIRMSGKHWMSRGFNKGVGKANDVIKEKLVETLRGI